MYQWRIFHPIFIFMKGILLFNPPQWKKIFHLHLLHKFLFWEQTLVSQGLSHKAEELKCEALRKMVTGLN